MEGERIELSVENQENELAVDNVLLYGYLGVAGGDLHMCAVRGIGFVQEKIQGLKKEEYWPNLGGRTSITIGHMTA